MTKSILSVSSILISLLLGSFSLWAEKKNKPNIVFFLVDDLGQRVVGCYGSQFHETPAIDQLAREGILFDNAYSTCHVCSPSRASILTGKYPARTNLTEWLGGRPERTTSHCTTGRSSPLCRTRRSPLAETLKRHGYATANYGKAHLRVDRRLMVSTRRSRGGCVPITILLAVLTMRSCGKKGDYYTDKLTDAALDFIERNKTASSCISSIRCTTRSRGRPDLVEKYRRSSRRCRYGKPDFILESNPDGLHSREELKASGE